jgi:succinate dehydrogenase/fumarate reductase flavoprotein subunit
MGCDDLLIVTDNRNGGTSRNTGSDKQTYYKLSDSTTLPDSPYAMVNSYTQGGAVHGDIAFVETQNSSRAFYNLISLGVPFPYNKYGGFVGYKTDHDPSNRGTSLGPFTSKIMVEQLQKEVDHLQIELLDHHDVVRLLVDDNDMAIGALMVDKHQCETESMGFKVVLAEHVVLGTGGPANFYKASVYPRVHFGSIGLAFEVGAEAVNLTESQYGIASTKFRWNLSGSYQQVLPRYMSTDKDGSNPVDFLIPYFSSWQDLTRAVFLKGYQWPFDAAKVPDEGSSLIDLLVYNETIVKGRRVYLDFTTNLQGDPSWGAFGKESVDETALHYLEASKAWDQTPYKRLKRLNPIAIELYLTHNIDISKEPLEVDVCAQHNNGGLSGDIWWESTSIKHLYPIGEINGSHGVSRPGGSALNSGQVGALRAATRIMGYETHNNYIFEEKSQAIPSSVEEIVTYCTKWTSRFSQSSESIQEAKGKLDSILAEMQQRMSAAAGPIRSLSLVQEKLREAIAQQKSALQDLALPPVLVPRALRLRHMLIAQVWYLFAVEQYIKQGGGSRGSFLIVGKEGIPAHEKLLNYSIIPENVEFRKVVQVLYNDSEGSLQTRNDLCREVPTQSFWFERVWADFRDKKYFD